jgi:toxin ParE1/3/4
MGRARTELAANLRSFVVLPFVVFYRPCEDTIEVIRVLHGSRDIDSSMMGNPET